MGEDGQEWLYLMGDEDGGHIGAVFAEVVDDDLLAFRVNA